MKNKKIIFTIITTILFASPIAGRADTSDVYHCPTIKETAMMQNIVTTMNDKDIHWHVLSNNNLMSYDKPIEFIKVVLSKKNAESYDMTIACFYRTENNKEFTINPLANWYEHVDGIAKKEVGHNWVAASNGSLECNKSIFDCGFSFR